MQFLVYAYLFEVFEGFKDIFNIDFPAEKKKKIYITNSEGNKKIGLLRTPTKFKQDSQTIPLSGQ